MTILDILMNQCISRKSLKGEGYYQQCPYNSKNGHFCGKHKNSTYIYTDTNIENNQKINIDTENMKKVNNIQNSNIITLEDFRNNKNIINNISIKVLKNTLKNYNIYENGRKPILQNRLQEYFEMYIDFDEKMISTIQSSIRRTLLRKIHGPAFITRSVCSNKDDFVTGDNIEDIHPMKFFSYYDGNSYYGFYIQTFNDLIKNGYTKNPYNQIDINDEVYKSMNIIKSLKESKNINNYAIIKYEE